VSFKPRRQVIIFSRRRPTISPDYLEAVAYAKKIGFYRILAATNGIRFAETLSFCKACEGRRPSRCLLAVRRRRRRKEQGIVASVICST